MQIEVTIKGLDGLKDGFFALAAALNKSEMPLQTPTAQETKAATTKRAKKNADEAAAPKAEAQKPEEAKTETAPEKKEDNFATLPKVEQTEVIRALLVKATVKLEGNKEKAFEFLKKYGANKSAELSDENILKVKADLDAFLGA